MNDMKWSFLFCAIFAFAGCVFHRPVHYPAQVLMKDGAPCFSVANRREERANTPIISAVDVLSYANNNKEMKLVWSEVFMRDRPPMELSPHECFAYGEGAEITPSLRKGHHYGVSIFASVGGYGIAYFSYFCLSGTPDGKESKIHHVKWNNKIDSYDWSVCGDKE